MEQLLKGVNQVVPQASKIMEINQDHLIFNVVEKLFEKGNAVEELKNISEILYNQALLIEGFELDNPVEFSNSLCELMTKAYN